MYSADPDTLGCFHAAVKLCQSASILVHQMGVDTGVDTMFVLSGTARRCQATEKQQFYSVVLGRAAPITKHCSSVVATDAVVELTCADGTFSLPVR